MRKLFGLLMLLMLIGSASAASTWYPRSADYNTSGDINADNGAFSGDVNIVGALTVGGVIVPQEVSLVVPITASSVDQYCFIADAAYNITGIREIHAVAGNDASPVNVTVRICDDTEAPASGLNVSTAVLSLKSSAATLQSATLNSSNVAVAANDMVALDFTGTLTTLAGGCVQIDMKRV